MNEVEKTKNIHGGSFLVLDTELENIFTPEDMSDEHRMIAQTAKQFIQKEVVQYREAIEKQDFDLIVRLLRKAGDLGLLAHSIPENYGGLGLDKISKGIVGEVVGASGGYGVAHSNHTCIATLPITYFGTKEQKEKYLPKLASGEYLGAYCLTEPGAGSDALASKTTAVLNLEKTHYLLNGTKIYITNAFFSDTFIVYAKVDGEKFTAFIVEKDFPGLSLGPEENKMGIKGSSTRSVILEDAQVPVENVLGEVGKGHVIALNVLNLGRFNLGFACMGGAKQALKLALDHTRQRVQFGKAIAEFNASKEKIATMTKRIYAAESVQYRTAGLLEGVLGDLYETTDLKLIGSRMMEHALECAICKVYGSETLDQVVDESLQLHGGAGFIAEYPIEQAYRDSRINRIFEGTNEINRLLIPSTLFRNVAQGKYQLKELIDNAVMHIQQDVQFTDEPLSREVEAVKSIRNIFLVCAGLAYETFGEQLKDEQETLMKLADLAIHLFAVESVVARTVKSMKENGKEQESLKQSIAISFVGDTLLEVEMISKKLISSMSKGNSVQNYFLLLSKEMNKYIVEGSLERNRQIADQIISEGQYHS